MKNQIEKYYLRKAFDGYLPDELLWRRKEAFSDGVSSKKRSWFEVIKEFVESKISDEEYEESEEENIDMKEMKQMQQSEHEGS